MHFPRVLRRAFVALTVVAGLVFVPADLAWSAPAVRIRSLPATPGSTVRLPFPASHLGVQWTAAGEAEADLEARWRSLGSGWTGWLPVHEAHDLEDHARGRHASGLLPTTAATAVEVRVRGGQAADVTDLDVVAIDAVHGPRRLVARGGATGGAPAAASIEDPKLGPPPIVRRTEWGADESLRGDEAPKYAKTVRFAVHHTASDEGPDPAATLRAILAYHTQANGWNDVGYNFVIDSQGRVYEGRWARDYAAGEVPNGEDARGLGVTGAHVAGNNSGTVGVALLGNFTGAEPSRAALQSLEQLLAWKADRHDVDLLGAARWSNGVGPAVVGHRDVGNTACPGGRLYDLLPSVRINAHHVAASARTDNPTLGYWTLGRDTALYNFGEARNLGGAGQVPAPAVSMARTPTGDGYWLLSSTGRITPFGDAGWFGSTETMRLNRPVVRLEPTPSGRGYWVLAADGGVFSFGDAAFHGSTGAMRLNAPVISMASTVTGAGYWLLAGDGGVFSFGDAAFHGSTGSMRLNAPVVSMAPSPDGTGYWLQAGDGGIFTFGPIRFYGSVPGLRLDGTARTVQIRATPTGEGYYVMGADGGVFTFGDARFHGARPGMSGQAPAIDLAVKVSPHPPEDDDEPVPALPPLPAPEPPPEGPGHPEDPAST